MAKRVKIYGAGSVGNHLANACRFLGWETIVCDVDADALHRTKTVIYPARYGEWDKKIQLFNVENVPMGGFDYIFIGTPPDCHISIAIEALKEKPKAVLIEKPLCTPDLGQAQELYSLSQEADIPIFVGYDHALGLASQKVEHCLSEGRLGVIKTIDVEFREHWGGILNAHPWLSGPGDSYLGSWKRGGGASGEHSHAIHLWQHFSHILGAGKIVDISASLEYVEDTNATYDSMCALNVVTDQGLRGRVIQDVVTAPPKKWGRIQGQLGFVEWHCGYKPGFDAVFEGNGDEMIGEYLYEKSRPEDFITEISHLEAFLEGTSTESPITLERGLDTMLVIAAAHKSMQEKCTVHIDYELGYSLKALRRL